MTDLWVTALITGTMAILFVRTGSEVENFKLLDHGPFIFGAIKLLQMSLQMSSTL